MADFQDNQQKNIFTRLKDLFSTDVVIRNVGGNQLKVTDTNKIQSSGKVQTNSLLDRFTKLYTTNSGVWHNQYNTQNYQILRSQLYTDYEAMDTDAIIASTLDIIADECTLKNDMGEVLQIRSSDENIQKILYNLFYDVLNIEFNLWSWIRNMCKYGDFFLKLEIAEKYGIYNVIPYSAHNIIREEGINPKNPSYVRFKYDASGTAGNSNPYMSVHSFNDNDTSYIYFDNYEMAHFRLIADPGYLPYGRSYIEPARKIWKQLMLMEDAMMIHRIMRAPEKRIHYINVGGIPPNEVDAFMQKTINNMKKTPYIDPKTGDYNLRFNMQNMLEDFYIPVRGNDQTTKIDTTKGLEYNGMEDINYLRDKLFAALKVPKAFMGYEKDLTGKATLAAEDIRFARTIERIQRIMLSELTKVALIHLYTQGYDGEELVNFSLSLTTPSIIYDQERINLLKDKVDLAGNILDKNLMPTDWIYDNIFHFSQDQYDEYRDLIIEDKKRAFRFNQIENEGNDPAESGETYGTPHDLASLYGAGRYQTNNDVPDGYNENEPGRPKEKSSVYGTQKDNLGKDRLGNKAFKEPDYSEPMSNKVNLALENTSKINYLQNKKLLESINKKKLVKFDKKSNEVSMLNEDTLIDTLDS